MTGNPPRWAEAVLRIVLRPADRESIPGDLLEEYRAVRRPSLGWLRSHLWYLKQVASFIVPLIWPFAAGLVVITAGSFLSENTIDLRYGSPIRAPGVSLIHALFYACAGYCGARRTGLVRTGMFVSGLTAQIAIVSALAIVALVPSMSMVSGPVIVLVVPVTLLIAGTYGVLIGAAAGVVGKRSATPSSTRVSASN